MTQVWLAVVAALLGLAVVFKLECLGLERDLGKAKAAHAIELKNISDAALAAQMAATKAKDDVADKIAEIDAKGHAKLSEALNEIDQLVAARATDRRRLSIAASCAAGTDRVPQTSDASSLDHGPGPRLTPAAEQHYFDLRRGIAKVTAQLGACQAYVRAVASTTSRTTNPNRGKPTVSSERHGG